MLQRLEERGPASAVELAEAAGVHENTVRAHVAVLEEAGLVAAEPRPAAGPGRPGVQYRVTAEGERMDEDFLGMAELLAAAIGRIGARPEQLHLIGQEWGRYLLGRPGRHDVAQRIPDVLRRLGFAARVDGDVVRLTGCPCPVVAADRPELICQLATGVIEGVLGASGADRHVGPARHDPARRDCGVTLVDVTGPRVGPVGPQLRARRAAM